MLSWNEAWTWFNKTGWHTVFAPHARCKSRNFLKRNLSKGVVSDRWQLPFFVCRWKCNVLLVQTVAFKKTLLFFASSEPSENQQGGQQPEKCKKTAHAYHTDHQAHKNKPTVSDIPKCHENAMIFPISSLKKLSLQIKEEYFPSPYRQCLGRQRMIIWRTTDYPPFFKIPSLATQTIIHWAATEHQKAYWAVFFLRAPVIPLTFGDRKNRCGRKIFLPKKVFSLFQQKTLQKQVP